MALHRLASTEAALGWLAERGVRALTLDSRSVRAGDAFIAWPGHAVDGRAYVAQALAANANACLVEAQGVEAFALPSSERIAVVEGLKAVTGPLASRFMGEPSAALAVIACTGTNGKTSMAWWAAQALATLGRRCGVIGTLGVGEPPSAAHGDAKVEPTGLTTPDPVTLHAAFRRFVDAGFSACAIEASSIGLVEHRLAGTHIAVALFSNFTQDHLDFHGSMAAYWQAKRRLFAWPGLRAAVVNLDDEHGAALAGELVDEIATEPLDLWTYSTRRDARLQARAIGYTGRGLHFDVVEGSDTQPVATCLIGDYNVSNLLAVIGGLRALGIPLADAARACSELTPVPGRMQRVPFDASRPDGAVAQVGPDGVVAHVGPDVVVAHVGPDVVVDYAHTPDALEKALLALQPFAAQRGGKLWCVFGCGGNRDAGKRPLMGALAQRLAQQVVITSDNPRLEAPAFILLQIVAGLAGSQERVKVIEDRAKAIAHAVRNADARDVILIAGKGHEDYQDAGGVKRPFSDALHAQAALQQRSGVAP